MANRYTDAAFKAQGLAGTDKLVLLVLCYRTDNEKGTCFPSYARIAQDAGISRSGAIRAVKSLIRLGLVGKVGTHGYKDGEQTNVFQVNLEKLRELDGKLRSDTGAVSHSNPSCVEQPDELRTDTGLVAYSNSGSGAAQPEELRSETGAVAQRYSNSELNSELNSEDNSSFNSSSGSNEKMKESSTLSSSSSAKVKTPSIGAEACQKLVQTMIEAMGEPDSLKNIHHKLQEKAQSLLADPAGYQLDQLIPVLRAALAGELDDKNYQWSSRIREADNPMAMFAKKIEWLTFRYSAVERRNKAETLKAQAFQNGNQLDAESEVELFRAQMNRGD